MFIKNVLIQKSLLIKVALASAMLTMLTGCPFDDDDNDAPVVVTPPPAPTPTPTPDPEYSYEVVVENLTNAQPMSPVAAVLHAENTLWEVGMAASDELEVLAEGGDNSGFIAQTGIIAAGSGDGILMPGMKSTVVVTTMDMTASYISVATMLVNTNDAFSGLTGVDLSTLAVDGSQSWTLGTYDAGTELNSEAVGTIPGPADGGTGYDATRDDTNVVAMHAGVVSMDDGLTSSVLTQAHRFDNPTVKLTITRTK